MKFRCGLASLMLLFLLAEMVCGAGSYRFHNASQTEVIRVQITGRNSGRTVSSGWLRRGGRPWSQSIVGGQYSVRIINRFGRVQSLGWQDLERYDDADVYVGWKDTYRFDGRTMSAAPSEVSRGYSLMVMPEGGGYAEAGPEEGGYSMPEPVSPGSAPEDDGYTLRAPRAPPSEPENEGYSLRAPGMAAVAPARPQHEINNQEDDPVGSRTGYRFGVAAKRTSLGAAWNGLEVWTVVAGHPGKKMVSVSDGHNYELVPRRDIITHINGERVNSEEDFKREVGRSSRDMTITVYDTRVGSRADYRVKLRW